MAALSRFFGFDRLDTETFATSHILSPRALFAVRLVVTLYALAVLGAMFYQNRGPFFFYLTCWGFLGLTTYFILATAFSAVYCFGPGAAARVRRPRHTLVAVNEPQNGADMDASACSDDSDRWSVRAADLPLFAPQYRPYQVVLWFLYDTVIVFHVLVPIIYWSMLYGPSHHSTPFLTFTNVASHATDLVLILIEVACNRAPLVASHSLIIIVCLLLYMALAYVVYAGQHYFVYPFLDYHLNSGWKVVLTLLAMVAGSVVLFYIQYFVHATRDRLGACQREKAAVPARGQVERLATPAMGMEKDVDLKE
ncbi:hypothetical protein IWQ60_002677 [Tieghemiomyces parasiticus]|uniref:Uncharacterized protein n=1 Tax=Tieghemiomyces parasiticus TaxID=78921 RepID=A0A9W8AAX2_9FUNG|nr:hypothetical protein IWQ60_002677 [Tieghemiomyces parasiticus]